jgi:hypothetical protein
MHCSPISGISSIVLALVPFVTVQAQTAPCPVVNDDVVSIALGTPVTGKSQANIIPGFDACDFIDATGTDFGVSRERNAFGPAEGGAAGLAQRYIPQLPDVARAQIDALSQAGINVAVPGYELTAVSGLGDSALRVKSELVPGFFKNSLLVQLGSDGFAFETDDSPAAQTKLSALAQAVLANLTP